MQTGSAPLSCRRSRRDSAGLLALAVIALVLLSGPVAARAWRRTVSPSDGGKTLYLPLILEHVWPPRDELFGIQVFVPHMAGEPIARVQEAGARWIRVPFKWSWVEPYNTTPDNYVWPSGPGYGYFDEGLAAYYDRGIQAILTFQGNPAWAATYEGGPIDKVDLSELVQFMGAAAEHYAGPPFNVRYWEFYNEPDNGSELKAAQGWGYWGNDGQAYAQMLAAVRPAMKAAAPEVQIVMGGLAYDRWTSEDPSYPFVESFLDDVLQNGGADALDVINFHYYPAFHAKWDPYGPDIVGKAAYLRAKLAEYGTEKPLICTEAGMWSDAENGGSDELQSRYVVQVYARALAADLPITIWYMLADSGVFGDWKHGLLNPNLTPKPAYDAYQTLTAQLSGARYLRTLEPSEAGSPEVEAYQFATAHDAGEIIVTWSNDDLEHSLAVAGSSVLIVQKDGNQTTAVDQDGDGWVIVPVGPSPVFLRPARL